jgi:hypothetical protein
MSELVKAIKEQGRHISSLRCGMGTSDAIQSLDELADMFESELSTIRAERDALQLHVRDLQLNAQQNEESSIAQVVRMVAERNELQARIDAAEKQEPYAWIWFDTSNGQSHSGFITCKQDLDEMLPCDGSQSINIRELYTHPAIPPEGMMLGGVKSKLEDAVRYRGIEKYAKMNNRIDEALAMLKAVPAKVDSPETDLDHAQRLR